MFQNLQEIKNPKVRDVGLDGLRVIGLLAIILAHVNPPAFIFQLRNFDVPLMVLVSGAVYGLSGTNKKYKDYIWGRVLRLLAPTWVFLCLFFLLNLFINKSFSRDTIISSFALLNGIGYVWIIRVFLLVAIIAPLFVYLYRKIAKKIFYLLTLVAVFIFYSVMYFAYENLPIIQHVPTIDFIFQNIIFYMLPFGCVAGLGLYLLNASKKSIKYLLLLFTVVFGILAYKYSAHGFMPTQAYKYPPGIYYLSYALAISLLLYLWSKTKIFQKIFSNKILLFIASSSLWIYLWQIFFLYQWNTVQKYISPIFKNFVGEYIFVISFAILFTFIQKYIFIKIVTKLNNNRLKSFLTVSFLK